MCCYNKKYSFDIIPDEEAIKLAREIACNIICEFKLQIKEQNKNKGKYTLEKYFDKVLYREIHYNSSDYSDVYYVTDSFNFYNKITSNDYIAVHEFSKEEAGQTYLISKNEETLVKILDNVKDDLKTEKITLKYKFEKGHEKVAFRINCELNLL